MTTSHTPGPWAYADYYGKKGLRVVGNRSICEMVYTDDVAEADARLIAEAPAMLEALNALLACTPVKDMADYGWRSQFEAVEQARAIIDRIEGAE